MTNKYMYFIANWKMFGQRRRDDDTHSGVGEPQRIEQPTSLLAPRPRRHVGVVDVGSHLRARRGITHRIRREDDLPLPHVDRADGARWLADVR